MYCTFYAAYKGNSKCHKNTPYLRQTVHSNQLHLIPEFNFITTEACTLILSHNGKSQFSVLHFFFFFVAFVKSNSILKITLVLCTLNLKWSLLEFKFVLFLAREVVTSMQMPMKVVLWKVKKRIQIMMELLKILFTWNIYFIKATKYNISNTYICKG